MHSIGEWWLWLVFFILITIVLGIDLLFVGGRKRHHMSLKESFFWTGVWVSLALLFNFFLWAYLFQSYSPSFAHKKAMEFFTAYLIEKSLSLDNIFVFVMIFQYFAVPIDYQRRILLYGVLGAITLRLVLILFGIWLIHQFEWIFYIFGFLLLYSAFRMFTFREQTHSIANNLIVRVLKRFFRVSVTIENEHFFKRQNGYLYITPLFIVLILVEMCDLMFAIDSIPAVFGITKDPFIAFTSNAFAILGLRALYFVLAHMHNRFYYLNHGLAGILAFIGIKMFLHDVVDIPVMLTLSVVVFVLCGSILISHFLRQKTLK